MVLDPVDVHVTDRRLVWLEQALVVEIGRVHVNCNATVGVFRQLNQ